MERYTKDHRHSLEMPERPSPRRRGFSAFISLFPVIALAGIFTGCETADGADTQPPPSGSDQASLEQRLEALEAKEDIRTTLLQFSAIVDSSDPARLNEVVPVLADDFVLDAIDYDGAVYHFEGADGLLNDYGPIMKDANANLMVSAIDVEIDDDMAYASFKFANSVKPPPQLNLPVDEKVLLFTANSATFRNENGTWKLVSLELLHSLAYPGTLAP